MNDVGVRIAAMQRGDRLVLGSAETVDVRIDETEVSDRHAEICRDDGGWLIRDLDSWTGTTVNGKETRGTVRLDDGDELRLGGFETIVRLPAIHGAGQARRASRRGDGLSVTLRDTSIEVETRQGLRRVGRTLVDKISFHVAPGEFVGILGASGSGKSTVMKTIAGMMEASGGTILLDGERVSAQSLQSDRRIAYMPQDVILHEELTPRRALGYSAKLKNIGGSESERAEMVRTALERVGVAERMDVRISRLSGGQRKRVALAAELLGDPKLILLDEATSGLDPATEGEMMNLFRSLANEGRTVVCITHFPGRLTMCDRILFLMEGESVFYGPPAELQSFFQVAQMEEVYVRQDDRSVQAWRARFLATEAGRSTLHQVDGQHGREPAALRQGPRELPRSTQAAVLTRRYIDLLLSDWKNVLLIFAQAPVIALMVAVTFGSIRADFAEQHAANTKQVIFVLVLAVLWCAGTISAREIVKEETVLRHENRFGVRLAPYLLSKLSLLTLISLIQAVALLAIVKSMTGLTGGFAAQYFVLGLTAILGVLLGLLISAISGSGDRAMTLLPVVLIAQAIFSGGIATLSGIVETFAWIFVPAYWSLDGLRFSFDSTLTTASYPGAPGSFQAAILGGGGPLLFDLLALAAQSAVIFCAAYVALAYKIEGSGPGTALLNLLSFNKPTAV